MLFAGEKDTNSSLNLVFIGKSDIILYNIAEMP